MGFWKSLFGGEAAEAENSAEQKEKNDARDFDVLKYDGVRALHVGQHDYAIQCFEHALQIQDDLEVRDYLSQALIRNNQLHAAREQLQILAQAQPDNVRIPLRLAEVDYMNEDYQAMLEASQQAQAIDANNPEVYFQQARAYKGLDNQLLAVAMLTQGIQIAQQGPADQADDEAQSRFHSMALTMMLLRGNILLQMGDATGAQADADTLVAEIKDNEDILMLAGNVALAQQRYDEAVQNFTDVIAINPFSGEAFRQRGTARMAQGDKNGAEEDMRSLLELNPDEAADVSGEYSAEGVEHKVRQAYSNINPFGL